MKAGSIRSWIAVLGLVGVSYGAGYAAPPAAVHWVATWGAAPYEQLNAPRQFRIPVAPPAETPPGAAGAPGTPGTPAATAPAVTSSPDAAAGAPPAAPGMPPASANGPATPPAGNMPAPVGAAQPGLPAGVPPAAAAAFRRFPPAPIYGSSDMTLREIVHVSLGGSRIRIVFTNEFGTEPLMIGPASVALSKGGHTVNTADASSVPLTFGGRESVSIPAGALMVSDPVSLTLPAQSDLAVSFFVPQQTITTLSQHGSADQTSYVADGNVVGAASFDSAKEIRSWVFDSEGGNSGAKWQRNGDAWSSKCEGVLGDGRSGSSVNSIQYLNDDAFVWRSKNRRIDGSPVADNEVKFSRRKEAAQDATKESNP